MILVPAIMVCPGSEYRFVKERFVTISPRLLLQIQSRSTTGRSEDPISEGLCISDAAVLHIPRAGRWVKKLFFLNDDSGGHTQCTKLKCKEKRLNSAKKKKVGAKEECEKRGDR